MKYFLDLFSIDTWENFQNSGGLITGFSRNQESQARRHINVGDIFICYLVKLGRWCGALRIESAPFIDNSPIHKTIDDPFIVRFRVSPIVILDPVHAVPVAHEEIWKQLSWTKSIKPGSVGWGANFQRSLREIPANDAEFILKKLQFQALESRIEYPFNQRDLRALRKAATVNTPDREVSVTIPDELDGEPDAEESTEPADVASLNEVRESHQIQANLAEIGVKMGFQIWIPRGDRERVKALLASAIFEQLIERLPMNYNEATVRTIEQIDVLWIKGRSIRRAFEVEHTTAIYSGLLRMADLVALQPDINISLHIVAPSNRTAAVLEQIQRPVFSLLDVGPLSDRCTLINYEGVRELRDHPHIQYMRDEIISEYEINSLN